MRPDILICIRRRRGMQGGWLGEWDAFFLLSRYCYHYFDILTLWNLQAFKFHDHLVIE